MLLKVKHAELNQATKELVSGSQDLDTEIDKMLKEIETLRTIWQGEDAVQFCDHANAYFTTMKNIPIAMRNIGKVMDGANKGYKDNDEAFASALKVEASNYEE